MKFSMNGFRRQLSNDVESLRDIVKQFVDGEFYEHSEIVEAMNTIITHSNVINCVYNKDDPDFVEMGNIEISHIEYNQDCLPLAEVLG